MSEFKLQWRKYRAYSPTGKDWPLCQEARMGAHYAHAYPDGSWIYGHYGLGLAGTYTSVGAPDLVEAMRAVEQMHFDLLTEYLRTGVPPERWEHWRGLALGSALHAAMAGAKAVLTQGQRLPPEATLSPVQAYAGVWSSPIRR